MPAESYLEALLMLREALPATLNAALEVVRLRDQAPAPGMPARHLLAATVRGLLALQRELQGPAPAESASLCHWPPPH